MNPNNAAAHYFYAHTYLAPAKRFDEAFEQYRIALSLDPLSSITSLNYAITLMSDHRYPEALAQFRQVEDRDPSFAGIPFYFAQFDAMTGKFGDAIAELKKFANVQGTFSADAQGFSQMLAAAVEQQISHGRGQAGADIAVGYAIAGDRNKAFEYLERIHSRKRQRTNRMHPLPSLRPTTLRSPLRRPDAPSRPATVVNGATWRPARPNRN